MSILRGVPVWSWPLILLVSIIPPRSNRMGATGEYFYFGLPLSCLSIKRGNMGEFTPGQVSSGILAIPLPSNEKLFFIPDGPALVINLLTWTVFFWCMARLLVFLKGHAGTKKDSIA